MKLTDFYKELKSNRTITFINVFGYSVALSACLIIGLFVFNQLNYDKFNTNADQIFRLNYIQNQKGTDNATTNHHWYQVLPEEVPGVEKAARFGWPQEQNIEYNKNNIKGIGVTGDKEIFDLFSFPVLQKEAGNFFEKPNSVALSKSLAGKIFGSENPIDKNITLNYGNQYTVTAVFDDIPANSTLQFEFITNAKDFLDESGDRMKNHWLWWMWQTFVLVNDQSTADGLKESMKPLQKKYIGDWHAESFDYYLQPLTQIHLHSSSISDSFDTDISITLIYILCSAGILILVISCINYINLSTAGFESRKKSVAVKKIIGASRSLLFKQYLSYSILLTFLCILIALVLSQGVIPFLNSQGITGIDIPFSSPLFWAIILIFGILTGILSGFYPAGYISRTVVISDTKTIKSQSFFRNGLITVQFTIAIILLIAVTTIKKQLNESTKGDLGFNYTSLISFGATESTFNHYGALHNEIRKIPGVVASTSCDFQLPGYLGNFWPVQPEGATKKIDIFQATVAPGFFDVLSIPFRNKIHEPEEDTASTSDRAVINSEAFKQFGLGEAILGKTYKLGDNKIEVIGTVNDFHIGSMHDRIKPIQFTIAGKCGNNIVRIEKENYQTTIAAIQKAWKEFEPTQPFEYYFIDELITLQYSKENSFFKLFNLFFVLALLISLTGLSGLTQLILKFRVKEIGIRKVSGAKISEVMSMLNKDFIKWVVIAFIIATPVAYFAMNKWLENFAYKTELSWWIFALAGLLALGIALLTVSWQSWKAATRNPVEALRYE